MGTSENGTPRLISLEVENFMRIKAVRLTPTDPVTILGGNNGEGKSSLILAMEIAISGAKSVPKWPVKVGATHSRIVADLDTVVIETTINRNDRRPKIVIRGKDGKRCSRTARAILDSFYDEAKDRKILFDPLEFQRMDDTAQLELVRKLAGVDTADIDREMADTYERRTVEGREATRLDGELSGLTRHPNTPDKEVSVSALSQKIVDISRLEAVANVAALKHQASTRECEQVKRALSEAKARVSDLTAHLKVLGNDRGDCEVAAKTSRTAVPGNADELRREIGEAESVNTRVRENIRYAAADSKHRAAVARRDGLSNTLEKLRGDKVTTVANAKMPIDDLEFQEDGLSYKGLPFSQASSAERLRVSMAIGFALHPKLKLLLIRDGSLLDEDSLRIVQEMTEAAGAQVLLERASVGSECSVIIEDGELVERSD